MKRAWIIYAAGVALVAAAFVAAFLLLDSRRENEDQRLLCKASADAEMRLHGADVFLNEELPEQCQELDTDEVDAILAELVYDQIGR